MTARYWDGRVRRVVAEVRRIRTAHQGAVVIERLECGHEFARTGRLYGQGHQYRVCEQCPEPASNFTRGSRPVHVEPEEREAP